MLVPVQVQLSSRVVNIASSDHKIETLFYTFNVQDIFQVFWTPQLFKSKYLNFVSFSVKPISYQTMTTFEGIKSFYDYRQVTVDKLNEDTDKLIKVISRIIFEIFSF